MKPRILGLMILFCILSLVSCESKLEKSQKQQQEQQQDKKEFEIRRAQDQEFAYRTPAVLLSLKYDMTESDVFKLLIECDDVYFRLEKDEKRKVKLEIAALDLSINELTELAMKFNTTPKKIAVMLIDFRSMRKCECECPES